MNYHQEYQASIDNPEAFWQDKALHLDWFTPPKKALSENTNGYPQWFKGGKLNTSYFNYKL